MGDTAIQAAFVYEATLDHAVLRACLPCRARGIVSPHPLVTGHPDGACPTCGAPSAAPEVQPTITADVDQATAAVIFGGPHG